MAPPRATGEKAIVIVEDEPVLLIIYRRLLQELTGGYEVIPANTGEDALSLVLRRDVPLLVTDYKLQTLSHGMNGIQLTRAVKEQSPETRVVLIIAYPSPWLETAARRAGVDYYLPKPHSLDTFERIVRQVLA